METPKKPQQTSEDEVTPAEPAVPSLQARSPYRPLSRRRRQELVPEPPPAVERPVVNSRFDASPTTISAALARVTATGGEAVLVWRPTSLIEDDISVEIDAEGDDGRGDDRNADEEAGRGGKPATRH